MRGGSLKMRTTTSYHRNRLHVKHLKDMPGNLTDAKALLSSNLFKYYLESRSSFECFRLHQQRCTYACIREKQTHSFNG